ncbi:PREDICTED: putative thiosulfate sulfurtransferase, mitochondrial [Polistes dominula]|uniref:Thiosulfate sulfurtransferase, mitochondrial n=1 Tax=Polistes dominula TaxID=743375 RepID=A0ABM1IPW4_POLDO|nr:PREDICTED: putative thiosulfate sulfurtransferase, mitochondrial [Polistes dominula]
MRFNTIRQIHKQLNVIGIQNRRLHFCSLKVPYVSTVLKHSIENKFVTAKQVFFFSNTFNAKGEAEIMSGENKSLIVNYNGILEAQKDKSILIIDVREPSEINETGKLPGSIHIPMGDVTNTLTNISKEDFVQKFNKSKPDNETKIILSCRSGKRSGMVQEELQKIGYKNVYNYIGGWLDWESNQK